MPDGSTFELDDETHKVKCPFCGGWYFAAKSDGCGVVMHSWPPCRRYSDLDALDFLTAARKRRESMRN